jgi:hypothetical protein
MFQEVVPKHFGDIRHAHGRSGVAGLRFLDGIHTQRTNGVGKFSARGH